ncbi:MAG TPA: recombination mediator RecR [Candidatus Coprenecus stercoravium]|uniref:Recombination protein RecR n=1 Tax=Candidatus Coprenecus stercoravium TaxID=2840735 RepID=A0A9D2KAT6_9BACT|nr:recombination mediator RecR [Candidatus Coprenecus stercoravium]
MEYSMMIPLLKEAVDALSGLPSIGEKTALRLALFLLRRPEEEAVRLGNALINLRTGVKYCRICNMISEGDVCPICADSHRDHSVICVVESVRDVMSIEETGEYKGVYHVLGGVISPMDGIGPDDLHMASLVQRVSSDDVREVILAISRGMEGETTSYYIKRLLSGKDVRISAIARGVGFGDDLEYTDSLTLGMSIKNRTPLM